MAAVIDLIGRRAIEQGSPYDLTVRVDGNFSGYTFAGSIRSGFSSPILASFQFSIPVYDSVANKTTIVASLTQAVTAAISATAENLRYDIKAIAPITGVKTRLIQGRVTINPEVRNA